MLHINDKRLFGEEIIFLTVSHFTHGWIQNMIPSLRKHCPETKIVVVDNNPSTNDSEKKSANYEKRAWNKERYSDRLLMCDLEKEWLNEQSDLVVVKTDNHLQHAEALNKTHKWLMENSKIKIVVHVEPDCLAYGRMWFDSFVAAVRAGFWFISGNIMQSNVMAPCPSAYPLDIAVQHDFMPCSNEEDKKDESYKKIIKPWLLNKWEKERWDVGHKFFYEAVKKGKALYMPVADFKHFGMGSRSIRHPVQIQFLESLSQLPRQ